MPEYEIPEEILTDYRAYRRALRDGIQPNEKEKAANRAYRRLYREHRPDPQTPASKRAKSVRQRSRRYKLTVHQYADLIHAQDAKCAICHREIETLCVDHDHASGRVRGLLCNACNLGLGHFADDIERLRSAIAYLENPPREF